MREQATVHKRNAANRKTDATSPLNDSLTDLGWLLTSLECITDVCLSAISQQEARASTTPNAKRQATKTTTVDWQQDAALKPPFPIATLIYTAIKSTKGAKASLAEIFSYISKNFLYYRLAAPSWKTLVRSTLAEHGGFQKVPRSQEGSGKRCCWTIDPAKEPILLKHPLPTFHSTRSKPMKKISKKKATKALEKKSKATLRIIKDEPAEAPPQDWELLLASSLNGVKAMEGITRVEDLSLMQSITRPQHSGENELPGAGLEFEQSHTQTMHPWACSTKGFLNKGKGTISSGCNSLAGSFNDVFPNFTSSLTGNTVDGLVITGTSIFNTSQGVASAEHMSFLGDATAGSSGADDYDALFATPYPSDWVVPNGAPIFK